MHDYIKIKYSIRNILYFVLLLIILIPFGIVFLLSENIFLIKLIVAGATLYLVPAMIYYSILNRIKVISFKSDILIIERFKLKNLSYSPKEITFLSKDSLKFGKKVFNLKLMNNRNELLKLLLKTMQVENIEQVIEMINNGTALLPNENDVGSFIKKTKLTVYLLIVIVIVLYTTVIILNHMPVIWVIGMIILIGLFFLRDYKFESAINNIESKYRRVLLNGLIYTICILMTIALTFAVYQLFKTQGIDLLNITF